MKGINVPPRRKAIRKWRQYDARQWRIFLKFRLGLPSHLQKV
jgi:hypothetical protein